jgi:hypothetical protein
MFFPENIERQILHNSTSKKIYNNKPLISTKVYGNIADAIIHKAERKIGGSANGVSTLKPAKLLHSSSMSGGSKHPNAWQTLIKNTMKEKGLSMKESIKYIKSNNLY